MRLKQMMRVVLCLAIGVLYLGSARADQLELLWQIAPDERDYVTGVPPSGTGTMNTERGIAYNPATGNLLIVSRAFGMLRVVILNAADGSQVGELNLGDPLPSGGTFALSMIGISDDGVIYVANLDAKADSNTNPRNVKIYRWENEAATSYTMAFEGDPAGTKQATDPVTGEPLVDPFTQEPVLVTQNGQRWGDSFTVRGSGANTQLLMGSRNGSVSAVFTTTDGQTFTSKIITGSQSSGAVSVAFGEGNTFYTKLHQQPARHVSFDLETGAATLIRTLAVGNLIAPIGVNPAKKWLAGIEINRVPPETPDNLKLFDISTDTPALIDQESFPGAIDNANFVGSVDMHEDLVFALDTNNGLVAYRVIPTIDPPTFATQPAATLNILEGGFARLSPTITGTKPFNYQWRKDDVVLPDGTNEVLLFTNVTAAAAGTYTLQVWNSAGTNVSEASVVTTTPTVRTSDVQVLWRVGPGERDYITTGNTERGVAYNVTSNHVLVVSRTGAIDINVLDGDTGEHLWKMKAPSEIVTGSSPGGFRLNMVAVADDGVVYAANLDISGADYKIYRWENDGPEAVPTVAFAGSPGGGRFGDTLDARGAGVDTQLLAATRGGTSVVIFTTFDGQNFFPNLVDVPDAAAGNFGLGAAFGEGNTFWGKASGPATPLRHVQFDLGSGLGTIIHTYDTLPAAASAVAVDPTNDYLALLAFDTPDNMQLYDISAEGQAELFHQEFFAADNNNGNGTGSADFGNGRLYALDTNNGLLAVKITRGGGEPPAAATLSNVSSAGGSIAFRVTGTPNTTYRVEFTSELPASSWSELKTVTTDQAGNAEVTDTLTGDQRYYRAVAP